MRLGRVLAFPKLHELLSPEQGHPHRDEMAHPRSLIAPLSRVTTCTFAACRHQFAPAAALPYQTIRSATTKAQPKKKKKARNTFLQYDLKKAEQFSLVDAMQYVNGRQSVRQHG